MAGLDEKLERVQADFRYDGWCGDSDMILCTSSYQQRI